MGSVMDATESMDAMVCGIKTWTCTEVPRKLSAFNSR
jgi:hypothetical protein